MTRVAIVSTVHQPLDGRIVYKQARSLLAAGFDVTLIARRGVDANADATADVEALGLKFLPLTVPTSKVSRVRLWLEAFRLLRSGGFDVWHGHDPELLPLMLLWRLLIRPRPRIVYDIHEDLSLDVHDKEWIPKRFRPFIGKVWERIDRFGAARVDLVVASRDSVQDRFEKFSSKCVPVRNYPLIEDSDWMPAAGRAPGPVRLIYVGGVSIARGCLTLVTAAEALDGLVELDIFGPFLDPESEHQITDAAADATTLHGRVPFTEVRAQLLAADIGVVLLHRTPKYIETPPVKLFEYYESGLPVLASDFEYWNALVPDSVGWQVDPEDPAAVAELLRSIVSSPDRIAEMGVAARRLVVEQYSWASEAATLIAAYNDF